MKLRIDFYDEDRPDGDQLLFFVEPERNERRESFYNRVLTAVEDALQGRR